MKDRRLFFQAFQGWDNLKSKVINKIEIILVIILVIITIKRTSELRGSVTKKLVTKSYRAI